MDIQNAQQQTVREKNKFSLKFFLVGVLGIFFLIIGFAIGKMSAPECNKSVLGTQTSSSTFSRLASLFSFNIERAAPQVNTIQLVPTNKPTEEPSPMPGNGTPSMIWSGLNRDHQPTNTPTPNNVIITPEQNNESDNSDSPSPTPKYKTNWDRTIPTPTKTVEQMVADKEKNLNDRSNDGKTRPTPILTPKPAREKIEPIKVKQIIDMAGIKVEKPDITINTEKPGYIVNGEIKDKLFGLLPVSYPVVVNINETSGEIEKVSIPWWRTLFGNPFTGNITQIRCGDGICSPSENYISCKVDCTPVCGNGICEYGEGQDTCPADCEVIPTITPIIGQ